MNKELDDLKNRWKDARKNLQAKSPSAEEIIALAKAKKKSTLYFQYGNIVVLALVLILVVAFFYFLFPFRETLSKTGVAIMIGVLVIRILIEIYSIAKSLKIDLSDPAVKTTSATLKFYHFRKIVNGPVTITLVALYSAGVYMLTPEFSRHLALWLITTVDILYFIAAVVLIWQIRKGILEEMKNLSEIVKLKTDLTKE